MSAYEQYYNGGWKNSEEGGTPITAAALNAMELEVVALSAYIEDLKTRLGAAAEKGVANNLSTTSEGYVLDARQGKALSDSVAALNSRLDGKVKFARETVSDFTANVGDTTLDLSHTESGYTAYFIGFFFYRSDGNWYLAPKSFSENRAILGYVNKSGSAYTVTGAYTMWLCIKS